MSFKRDFYARYLFFICFFILDISPAFLNWYKGFD